MKRVWIGLFLGATVMAQDKLGYDDTPLLPGSKWRVHDGKRPQPDLVKPDPVPSDAIVLFDGKDLSKWKESGWKVENGYVEIGKGNLVTKEEFGDCQFHIEWCAPSPAKGEGQGRGNSGIFFLGRYELQILDSYENKTYPDGQAAALYGQYPPMVNASRAPGEWQSYDIVFIAPRFEGNELKSPAKVTVFHNGVVVHHAAEMIGQTTHRAVAKYSAHGPKGPVMLQDHGDPVRFRNIWIRPL